jgi:hypothetical protein
MDSTLIHLLPNLFPSSFGHHRHGPRHPNNTSPTSQQQQQALTPPPPPPYTLHPPTDPTPTTNIPLTISLLGNPKHNQKRPLLYRLQTHLQTHLPLGPETTYQEFIDDLRVRLERLGVNGGNNTSEKGSSWRVGIVATGRRYTRAFGRRVLWGGGASEMEVGRESWEEVRRGFFLAEGRLAGLRVDCWREW